MAKVSQRQILAQISPVTGTAPKWTKFLFAQVSGGEITASVEKIYAGGAKFPEVLCAPAEIGDITLTAHYDSDRVASDSGSGIAAKIKELRPLIGRVYYDINISTYDCDIVVQGLDRTYSNCLLVGMTEPDGDSSSGAPATFALTFAVQGVV
jgi:hypothetical protein